ncbi:MAG: bifunctional adenosylcobinamide kinase/adenosylcobinamide-phosphate guanylyltransferase, partial [Chloroflexi bacterium]|nr:bifunctional adenosylcobinamide kinase/adenosylcobinamide-phosphate guanylyltransferase [Chloroflexota bacterium]
MLVLGGARSGKSRFAQETAHGLSSRVLYVATAEPLDAEMATRITAHRQSRPAAWKTIEAPRSVANSIRAGLADADVVVLDCLTLLVSNVLSRGNGAPDGESERAAVKEAEDILEVIEDSDVTIIIVSNEVGLGLVPD